MVNTRDKSEYSTETRTEDTGTRDRRMCETKRFRAIFQL